MRVPLRCPRVFFRRKGKRRYGGNLVRPASQEKATLTAKYKSLLTPDYLKTANVANGRQLFNRTCASCHVLFDAGNKVGPELTELFRLLDG